MRKQTQVKKDIMDARIKLVLTTLRNDRTQRKDYVSGIILGMGYNTMVEFLEDCVKFYGMCYEIMEIGAMYYMADFDKHTILNIYHQAKDIYDKEVKE